MGNTEDTKLLRRLKIIEGQVRGLYKMVNDEVYCIDIITQTTAVKKALSSVEDFILEKHLSTCAMNQIKDKNESTAIREILSIYKLSKNK